MARIKFPTTFAKLVKLFTDFKTKFDAEAPSVTQPFLDEQGIDPTADLAAVTEAVAANTAFDKAERDGEEFTEERDDLFEPVFGDHTGCVQFLKKLFRGNVTKLGEWGQTVDARGRVVYPPDFMGRTEVVDALITKHGSFPPGALSPLQPYLDENDIVLTDNKSALDDAITAHNNFLAQDSFKEEKRELRDTTIEPVEEHLRGIGQFLVGLFSSTPHKAGEWGFIVDDSPQANTIRVVEINPGATKTVRNLAVGKIFKNVGLAPLNLYSGDEAIGTAHVLNPGASFNVVRGYGIMTVINVSDSTKGVYEGEFNQ